MKLVELQQILRAVDPAAVLVAPHILDRIVQQAYHLPRVTWTIPHRKSFIVDRQVLFQHVDQAELPVAPDQLIPPTVMLLAYPSLDDLNDRQEPLLRKYWRRLFHTSIHKVLEDRWKHGQLSDADIRERIGQIGRTEFEEIRTVLTQDMYLPASADDRLVYMEFAALFLELEYFASNMLGVCFPGIWDRAKVKALLARDVDAAELFSATRPAGAPSPVVRSAGSSEEAHEYYYKLILGADKAALEGNTVRAAVLRWRAARVAPGGMGPATRAAAVTELDKLTQRLQSALQLGDQEAAEWQKDLPKLLDKADQGSNAVEAALLFDLQKICFDHEQDIYALDLVEWLISGFRRPIKRPLPSLRVVRLTRHLRSAVQRLTMARLSDDDRRHFAALLDSALQQSEERLRTRFRPILRDSLYDAGLSPANAPEQTAFEKMVEEMLDHISAYGYLTFSDLRDVISRNQLKLPDLQDPQDFIRGDQLLRLDRRLFTLLDGVYKPSELYQRWLERFAALNFGSNSGRWLTRYVTMPFLTAFLILFAGKLLLNDIHGWIYHALAPKITLAPGNFPGRHALDARKGAGVLESRDDFNQPPFTVEFFTKLFSADKTNILVANEQSAPLHWQFFTEATSGKPVIALTGKESEELKSGLDICDEEWHHLALVFDGSEEARFFVDGELVARQTVKLRSRQGPAEATVTMGAASPHLRAQCNGLIDQLRISSVVRDHPATIPVAREAKAASGSAAGVAKSIDVPGAPFQLDRDTRGLAGFESTVVYWQRDQIREVAFLGSIFFWLLWLALGALILALFQSQRLRQRIAALARACWRPLRALFVELPHWLLDMPVFRRISATWSFQLAWRYLLLPLLLAFPLFFALHALFESRLERSIEVCAIAAFIFSFVLVNSYIGQAAQALMKQTVTWLYELFHSGFIPGLARLVALLFKEVRDVVETVMFTVDEWLRFRKGESRLSMVVRTLLGVLWFPFSYLLRFYFLVLIEPCINPPKLAISTVAAKIVYPLLIILGLTNLPLATWSHLWSVNLLIQGFIWLTLWLSPDAIAFLLWEMWGNYRLYRANRSSNLRPVPIGTHGETLRGLLQPGFHSGTIPRLYTRLRRAEKRAFHTGNWRAVRVCVQSLQEVSLAVQRFVERELVHLLRQTPEWRQIGIHAGRAHLATNRISVELLRSGDVQPVYVEFEYWSGWLMAGIRHAAWLTQLRAEEQQTLSAALAGLYKLAGIDLVREQLQRSLPAGLDHYELTADGLTLWQGDERARSVAFSLREQDGQFRERKADTANSASLLDVRRVLYSKLTLPWSRWVHTWQKNAQANGEPLFDEPIDFLPGMSAAAPPSTAEDFRALTLTLPGQTDADVSPPMTG